MRFELDDKIAYVDHRGMHESFVVIKFRMPDDGKNERISDGAYGHFAMSHTNLIRQFSFFDHF